MEIYSLSHAFNVIYFLLNGETQCTIFSNALVGQKNIISNILFGDLVFYMKFIWSFLMALNSIIATTS